MKVELVERTFAQGSNCYKVFPDGKWQALLFGTYPDSNGTPSYRWMGIPESEVPSEVVEASQ